MQLKQLFEKKFITYKWLTFKVRSENIKNIQWSLEQS